MTRDEDDKLERQIQDALRAEDGESGNAPLDLDLAAQMAAYLDGTLEASEREAVEEHLASSPASRRLAMESALLLADRSSLADGAPSPVVDLASRQPPRPSSRPPRQPRAAWPLALAAGLAALVAGLWSMRQVEPSLAPATSPVDAVAEARATSPDQAVARALDGELPVAPAFAALLDAGQRPVLRHFATDLGPAPLSPRWSIVSSPRPVFSWRMTTPDASGEIFLVDGDENLVATFPFQASTTPITRLALPEDVPDLDVHCLYAWKVNVHWGTSVTGSDYVPFQVVPDDAAHAEELGENADALLRHAARLATEGRFDDALATLARLDVETDGWRAEPLLAAIFERQHAWPKLERLQRQELGWPETPLMPPGAAGPAR